MIDLYQPLELDDGTPVKFDSVRIFHDPHLGREVVLVGVILPDGKRPRRDDSTHGSQDERQRWFYHMDTGRFHRGTNAVDYLLLRNVGDPTIRPGDTAKLRQKRRIAL